MQQAHVLQARHMRKLSVTDGKWILQCLEAVKNIVVMNVNEVEKVASQVDFVFSAVDMTKDEIKCDRRGIMPRQRHLLFPTTPHTDGHRMYRWSVPEINAEPYQM